MTGERSRLAGGLWFALLCAAALFAPWLGGQIAGVGPAVARALVCAAGLAWVVDRWGQWTLPRPAAWLWLFTGWSAVTALQGNNAHDSLMALSNLVSWAVLATLAADAAREPKRRDFLVASILLGLTAVGAQGVWDSQTNVEGWRVFGPFATPNLYASYLITLLPLGILGTAVFAPSLVSPGVDPVNPGRNPLVRTKRSPLLLPMAGGFVFGLGALLSTASKGAVAAFAVAVLIAFLLARFWRVASGSGLFIVGMMSIPMVSIFGGLLFGRVGAATAGEAHSGQFRVLTWEATAKMAAANPILGTGIGTFGSTFNKYAIAGWTEAAHNAYLQTAAETGVLGLLLFLAALGSAALWLFRAAASEDRTVALLGAAGLAGLLAAAAHNLVDYGWTVWAPSAALWLLIGLGVGGLERANRAIPRPAALAMMLPLVLGLLGGILVANAASMAEPAADPNARMTLEERVAALRSARGLDPLDADLARRLGLALAQAGAHETAIRQLEDATRLAPGEPTAWRFLGEAYRNSGQPDRARETFACGLQNAPNSYKLLLDAAELAETQGRREDALAHFERIVQAQEGPAGRYPATPEIVPVEPIIAYAALAREAERRGDPDRARTHREALVALAKRYEANREAHPLIWQATGQDNPESLAVVRALRAEAERALATGPRDG